ncbi:MAG: helix-turn-helix domain-containing protein, partial [Phormidesmis sp. CAN_BIN44]|nr:helix-turn-helix domain-containing protein [Phormidesmis sp. CAN_BIN44]
SLRVNRAAVAPHPAATADDAAPCPSTDAFTLIQLFLTASPQTYTCKRSLSTDPTRSVTSICEHLGISRPTYYRCINPDLTNIAENKH